MSDDKITSSDAWEKRSKCVQTRSNSIERVRDDREVTIDVRMARMLFVLTRLMCREYREDD